MDKIKRMLAGRGKNLMIVLLLFVGILIFGMKQKQSKETAEQECTRQIFAMDTTMTFTAYGEQAQQAVEAVVKKVIELDELLSTGLESSEISKINQNHGGKISEDTAIILHKANDIYSSTDGLFDITIFPMMKLWGFQNQEYRVPTEEEIAALLPKVDMSEVVRGNSSVQLGEGQEIDLGGIAKGYASDQVMKVFREYGVKSAIVSLGGNVQTLGTKLDGSVWNIGIRDPLGEAGSVMAGLEIADKAVITSGGYERYFEEDGKKYIHILDPRTGYPADGDLISVSIVSDDGMLADALSTSLYIMGLEKAEKYWKKHKNEFDAVFVTDQGEIYVTEGISEVFHCEKEFQIVK